MQQAMLFGTSGGVYGPWSFVAAGAVSSGSSASAALPVGWQANDLLIVTATANSGNVFDNPAGWNVLFVSTNFGQHLAGWYKTATYTESSVTPTISGSGNATCKTAMIAYRGVQTYPNTVDVSGTASGNSTSSIATNSLITTAANDLIVSFYGAIQAGTAPTWTAPASTTSRVLSNTTSIVSGLLIVDENQAVAGASATRTATLSASDLNSAFAVSFKQAG